MTAVGDRCSHPKRQGLIDANPFEFVRHRPGDASERRAYVPASDVARAIEHTLNGTWGLLIALSRFADLRVPSEALRSSSSARANRKNSPENQSRIGPTSLASSRESGVTNFLNPWRMTILSRQPALASIRLS